MVNAQLLIINGRLGFHTVEANCTKFCEVCHVFMEGNGGRQLGDMGSARSDHLILAVCGTNTKRFAGLGLIRAGDDLAARFLDDAVAPLEYVRWIERVQAQTG